MCLTNCRHSVKRVLEGHRKTIDIWKRLKVINNKLCSPIYLNSEWSPGIKKSNSKRTKTARNHEKINRGIHVFVSYEAAQLSWINGYTVKMTALKKDLIGANLGQAVFNKVKLSRQEYRRIKKLARGVCNA